MSVRATSWIFIYGECVTEVCEAELNWRESKYRAISVLVLGVTFAVG